MPTINIPVTKTQADSTCAAQGSHVAAPETAEENTAITTLVFTPRKAVDYNIKAYFRQRR